VEQATAHLNKPSGVCCFFLSAHPFPCYFPLSGCGGLGRWCGDSAVGGFGGGGGLADSERDRGAGRRSASLSPPSSPLPACLGGEGKRGWVEWQATNPQVFVKRSFYCSGSPPTALAHLAGRGGEEVVEGVFEEARCGSGLFQEPSEIRLFQAFHQRRRCAAAATRGHMDGRALLGAMLSASSFLRVRIFHSFIVASRPPAQPSVSSPAGIGAAPP
jgi:hypothetical protein